MRQRLFLWDVVVPLSDRKSVAGAGCRERFKTEMGQDSSTSDVPRVRNDECGTAFMERTKSFSFFILSHVSTSSKSFREYIPVGLILPIEWGNNTHSLLFN